MSENDRSEVQEGRSTVEALRAARERISDPERWTQEFDAVDGKASASDSLLALPEGRSRDRAWALLTVIAEHLGFSNIPDANDSGPRTVAHARVLLMFDKAIEKAEAI